MAHLKKAASGHLFKNAAGHLVNSCSPCFTCPGTGGSAVVTRDGACDAECDFYNGCDVEDTYDFDNMVGWEDPDACLWTFYSQCVSGGNLWRISVAYLAAVDRWDVIVENGTPGVLFRQFYATIGAGLHAQLWAKSSTDPKAVFMGDPGMPVYGRAWTEYSRRASFGSVRDWLHIPIVYHADLKGFKEGVRRLSLLGVDPYTYKKSAFSSPHIMPMVEHTKTIDAARAAYYSMSPDSLIDLASREGINFFIFMKNYAKPPPDLARVFENKHFVILAPQYASMNFN